MLYFLKLQVRLCMAHKMYVHIKALHFSNSFCIMDILPAFCTLKMHPNFLFLKNFALKTCLNQQAILNVFHTSLFSLHNPILMILVEEGLLFIQ